MITYNDLGYLKSSHVMPSQSSLECTRYYMDGFDQLRTPLNVQQFQVVTSKAHRIPAAPQNNNFLTILFILVDKSIKISIWQMIFSDKTQ